MDWNPGGYVSDVFGGRTAPAGGRFGLELRGHGSRVELNGVELPYVRDVKVHQPLDGPPIVTVEFAASEVTGLKRP